MHIAADEPPAQQGRDVPAEFVAKEKEIELAKMSDKDKAKPADILEKIISGKINKIVNEVTLYGQPYVLDSDKSVEQVVKAAGATWSASSAWWSAKASRRWWKTTPPK